jgi:uncharacterized membrane protein
LINVAKGIERAAWRGWNWRRGAALPALLLCGLFPGTALAELKVCNQTLNLYNVAIGYFDGAGCFANPIDEASCHMKTEGWWNLPANGCVSPYKFDLETKFYYVFASDIYGEDAVTGETELCVKLNAKFEIQTPLPDIIAKAPGCWQKGFQQVKFKEIDTHNGKNWTVFLGQ